MFPVRGILYDKYVKLTAITKCTAKVNAGLNEQYVMYWYSIWKSENVNVVSSTALHTCIVSFLCTCATMKLLCLKKKRRFYYHCSKVSNIGSYEVWFPMFLWFQNCSLKSEQKGEDSLCLITINVYCLGLPPPLWRTRGSLCCPYCVSTHSQK